MKNRKFDKKVPQNFCSERATIAERQDASENENFEVKPTPSKSFSSMCLGIYWNLGKKGLDIKEVKGSFCGLDLDFYKEKNGALVGGASLKPSEFIPIVQAAKV